MDKSPYRECPGFEKCSAPRCPLDPEVDTFKRLSGEDKCRAQKPTRTRIGKRYPEVLIYQGLTKKEFNGIKKWEGLGVTQKELILETLAKTKRCPKVGI